MKRTAIILIILLSSAITWATSQPNIRQYNESYTVDLASDAFLSHTTGSKYVDLSSSGGNASGLRNNGFYYRQQELGVIGITGIRHEDNSLAEDISLTYPDPKGNGTKIMNIGKFSANGTITITVDLLSGEWFYALDDNVYKRPFGLDLFAGGRAVPKGKTAAEGTDVDISGYCLHLGNQSYSHGEAEGVFSKTLPADVVRCYDFIWWDICLVMDPVVDTSTDTVIFAGVEYPLLPSNITYKVDLQITLECSDGGSQTYPFHLEGFYKTDAISSGTTTNIQPILSVSSTPNSLRIDGGSGLIATRNKPTQIASYDFTTTSKMKADTSSKAYLFLSSSSQGYNNDGGVFALHHVKDPSGVYVKPITFKVIMESTNTNIGDGQYEKNGVPYYRPLPHRRNQALPEEPEEPIAPEVPGENASEEEQAAYLQAREEYETALENYNKELLPAYNAAVYRYRTVVFDGTDKFTVSGSRIPSNAMEIYGEITKQKAGTWYTRWIDSGTISIQLTGNDIDGNPVDINNLAPGQYSEDIYFHVIMF